VTFDDDITPQKYKRYIITGEKPVVSALSNGHTTDSNKHMIKISKVVEDLYLGFQILDSRMAVTIQVNANTLEVYIDGQYTQETLNDRLDSFLMCFREQILHVGMPSARHRVV
jgi:hypothetical protein